MARRIKTKVSQPGLSRYLKGGTLREDVRNVIEWALKEKQVRRDQLKASYDSAMKEHDLVEIQLKQLEKIEKKRKLNLLEREEWDRLFERSNTLFDLVFRGEYHALMNEILAIQLFLCHMDYRDSVIKVNSRFKYEFRAGEHVYLSDLEELPFTSMN